jgi:hypothetical protein
MAIGVNRRYLFGFAVGATVGAAAGGGAPGNAIGGRTGNGEFPGAASGVAGVTGLRELNSRVASEAQKLVLYWLMIVSQTRRASSNWFFAFSRRTAEINESGALKLVEYLAAI